MSRNTSAPSVATLVRTFRDVDAPTAKAIRKAWLTRNPERRGHPAHERADRLSAVDRLLGTHGTVCLGTHKRTDESVTYCNAGDPYSVTLIAYGETLRVGCWGDLVEGGLIRDFSHDDF